MGLSKVVHDPETWVSLRQARRNGASLGTLATAVEKSGIYGWDKYGRFAHFEDGDDGAQRVLGLLARAYEAQDAPTRANNSAADDEPHGNPWDEFGWPANKCPKFEQIAAGQTERPAAEDAEPSGSEWLLLAALQELLVGPKGSTGNPRFTSNAHMLATLQRQYLGVRGLGERSVEGNLARARLALHEAKIKAGLTEPKPLKR